MICDRKYNRNYISHFEMWLRLVKVQIFWEGHKLEKNLPLIIWRYSVVSNVKWKIFSNFVAFSEYLNFTPKSKYYDITTQDINNCMHITAFLYPIEGLLITQVCIVFAKPELINWGIDICRSDVNDIQFFLLISQVKIGLTYSVCKSFVN